VGVDYYMKWSRRQGRDFLHKWMIRDEKCCEKETGDLRLPRVSQAKRGRERLREGKKGGRVQPAKLPRVDEGMQVPPIGHQNTERDAYSGVIDIETTGDQPTRGGSPRARLRSSRQPKQDQGGHYRTATRTSLLTQSRGKGRTDRMMG